MPCSEWTSHEANTDLVAITDRKYHWPHPDQILNHRHNGMRLVPVAKPEDGRRYQRERKGLPLIRAASIHLYKLMFRDRSGSFGLKRAFDQVGKCKTFRWPTSFHLRSAPPVWLQGGGLAISLLLTLLTTLAQHPHQFNSPTHHSTLLHPTTDSLTTYHIALQHSRVLVSSPRQLHPRLL